VRTMPCICEFYPGICRTTEEKAWENFNQSKKNLSLGKKNLSQITVYILPKHTQAYTLQNPHIHTRTHTLQNNIKPPQYKLKQTQYTIYPNETVTI
jgi:hypothetical protein